MYLVYCHIFWVDKIRGRSGFGVCVVLVVVAGGGGRGGGGVVEGGGSGTQPPACQ